MRLGKKLAVAGLVGILTVGQSVSALAAERFSMSLPTATLSGRTSGYSAKTKCSFDTIYSQYFLKVSHTLGYFGSDGYMVETPAVSEVSRSVISSLVSEVTVSGSSMSESDIDTVRTRGYYGNVVTSVGTFAIMRTNTFR